MNSYMSVKAVLLHSLQLSFPFKKCDMCVHLYVACAMQFVCRLLMRMMNERGQDERSLDSSLRDDQTKAEQIKNLRTVATRLGSVTLSCKTYPKLDPKASLSIFTYPDGVYFLVEFFPYTDSLL